MLFGIFCQFLGFSCALCHRAALDLAFMQISSRCLSVFTRIAVILSFSVLALTACSNDGTDENAGSANTAGSGIAQEGDAALDLIVDELKGNAEQFEYTVGQHGGDLTIATISEPLTFNLAIADDSSSSNVLGYLFEGLTELSWLTDEVEPALAESWERSEDGLSWQFNLRRDVTWHDGTPFTAHDVDFTFNEIIYNDDIDTNARAAFEFRFLDENDEWQQSRMTVTVIDDHTVGFVLPVQYAPFLRSMGTAIYPKHILEQHVDNDTFDEVWDIDTDPAEVIGTGPFVIESYTPEQQVVLARNPNYWMTDAEDNRLPYLDKIVYTIVENLEAELEAFKTGQSDVHGVLGEEYAELEALQEEQNFTIHRRGPGFSSTFLTFNVHPGQIPGSSVPYVADHKRRWFNDLTFRRAVAYSVDKNAIIEEVQHGLGYPQWSPISPASEDFYNPDVMTYPYDVDKAKELLDELGWVDTDDDGIREDGEGNEIEFRMVTNTDNSVREKVGQIIAEGMKEIGLNVSFELIEFGDLVDQLTSTYAWEAVVIGFGSGSDPYSGIVMWHSSGDFHLWYPFQEEPATEWEAEIDELYVKASQELDHEKRVEYYHRSQEIAAENVPLIYTTLSERLTAARNVFGNVTPTLYAIWDIRYLHRLPVSEE